MSSYYKLQPQAIAPVITGNQSSPVSILAASGITPALGALLEIQFIVGNAGPVTVAANPQIAAGTSIGQVLSLLGTSNIATVTLNDGNGLLLNGQCILRNGSQLSLIWNGTVWSEESRNDI